MPYKIDLTQGAIQDLESEAVYSQSRWGKHHAAKYIHNIQNKLKALKQSPFLSKTHDDILPGLRILAYKGNNILYWVNEPASQVIILGIPSIYRELSSEVLAHRLQTFTLLE